MDFDDFLQDNAEGAEANEQGGDDAVFEEMPDDLFSDLSIQVDENRSKKDSVIFLVDCRRSIFEKLPDSEQSGFQQVMKAYQGFLKSKIVSSENDKIGLVFYNIKNFKNNLNIKGINLVHDLDIPTAQRIRTDFEKDFPIKFGFADVEVPLHEVLWICNHELKALDQKAFTKRVFLFTNEDFPSPAQKNDRDQAIQRAKMLYEMDVKLELFPIQRRDRKFDLKKFYVDLIAFDPQDVGLAEIDISSKIMDINKRMRAKEFKKRTLANIFLDMGENFKIGVSLYCLLNKAKKPTGQFLDAKTNKTLKSTTNLICKDTGATLYPNQIGTCVKIGGEKIPLQKEEVAAIKKFDDPGVKLMGFKPKTALKIYHNIRSSYFVFPNDERISNSSQLCDALLKKMVEKDVIAIVKIVPRKTSSVRFAALLPQLEAFDNDHFQTPSGFNMVFLPYADDMRKPDQIRVESINEPSESQLAAAKLLINSISADADCRSFENPAIQTFYTRLQAIALDEKKPEDVEDLLQPDEENIQKIYAEAINIFNNAFTETIGKKKRAPNKKKGENVNMEEEKKPSKKPNNSSQRIKKEEDDFDDVGEYDYKDPFMIDDRKKKSGNGKNQTKMEVEEGFTSEEERVISEVEENLRTANLKKLTTEKLKFYLKVRKCSLKGKKEELIDRALEYLTQGANNYK